MRNFLPADKESYESGKSAAALVSDVLTREEKAWLRLMGHFWQAEDDFCNERFKLIPTIVEGNWTVKMAVGSKPALTGTKITQKYFRGKGYFEVDVDISSSAVAVGILALVSQYFCVSLTFVSLILCVTSLTDVTRSLCITLFLVTNITHPFSDFSGTWSIEAHGSRSRYYYSR